MNLTRKAILARCNGDREAARRYCVDLAIEQTYKNKTLSSEYWQHAEHFGSGSAERN